MDFTYYFVGFTALIVGFVAAIVFVLIKGRSKRRLFLTAFAIAIVLSGAWLINWAHLEEASAAFILVDLVFFALYSLIGSAIGATPTLLLRLVWRKVRSSAIPVQNSN